ncbi:MAG: sporulation protein YabP [Bacillota bacterium]
MIDDRKEKRESLGEVHQVKLLGRRNLSLEGITAMGSYDDTEIYLDTSAGALYIKGQDLHIKQLNLDEGRMEVEGTFVALTYSDTVSSRGGKGFLSKLLR